VVIAGLLGAEFEAGLWPIAGGGAFFVVGEEGGFFQASLEGVAFGGEGFDLVEVGA
jgi:hypothetical protein